MNSPAEIDRRVGERLRALRIARGMTLTALAEQTGLSAPHLSRLEKADRQPSIAALLQLARIYGVSVSDLVEDRRTSSYHLLRSTEPVEHQGEDGTYTVLSGPNAAVAVMRVQLLPGARTAEARHVGEEWLQILSGSGQFVLADEVIDMHEGDAIQFDSARPHYMINSSDHPQTVLIASIAAATPTQHPLPSGNGRR